MKKSLSSSLVLMSILCINCAGCDKLNYVFDLTDYTVDRSSRSHVIVVQKSAGTIVVDQQVVDYSWEGPYLLVLRMPAVSKDCWNGNARMIVTFYSNQEEYWAIETKNDVISGPMDKKEFDRFLNENELQGVRLTIPKDYMASSTSFMEKYQDCSVDIE